jgi:hypothetical protein
LKIDGTATSVRAINTTGQNSLSTNGVLEIGAKGKLTIGVGQTVNDSGTIQIDGGTLTDSSGITFT